MKLILVVAMFAISVPALAQDVSGRARAADGDSLDLSGISVRLHGIDAPELLQSCERAGTSWPCGKEAAGKLADLVGRGSVECEQQDVDDYGRIVARCRVGSIDLGEAMVSAGLAVALPRFSDRYVASEARARDAGLGVWAGSFQMPADYRAAHPRPKLRTPEPPRASMPRSAPTASPSGVYYRNCKEAWAAGAAPLRRGQPGYRPEMDGDGDGIACEPYRGR
ncbi:thermonuclease family protein [Sphingopyxis sp.]|uniref:thermonuclease family protein n=1 Tax=Sphingopyxis sp. TaxID=1908224 RepID=UPI003D6D7895